MTTRHQAFTQRLLKRLRIAEAKASGRVVRPTPPGPHCPCATCRREWRR